MRGDLNRRIQEAKECVEQRQSLARALPAAQERRTLECNQLLALETALDEIDANIKALESFTLTGFLEGLFGRKEHKLSEARDERYTLQEQFDECARAVEDIDAEVKDIAKRISEIGDADDAYQFLCDQKHNLIVERADASAAQLEELCLQIEGAKTRRHSLATAIRIGKNALERLHSMTKTLGRARNKMLQRGSVAEQVLCAPFNQASKKIAQGAVDRAEDGVVQFHQLLDELDLSGDELADAEIKRLKPALAELNAELAAKSMEVLLDDSVTVGSLLGVVQEISGHLKDKLKETESRVDAFQRQRLDLIESA